MNEIQSLLHQGVVFGPFMFTAYILEHFLKRGGDCVLKGYQEFHSNC